MARKILVADLLCGAGGSSTGCARALRELGLEMELVCVNHWGVAIETHKKNHPEARHYCQDIATVRPHLIVPEGYLDLLMASPTCTHHSVARGGKPTSDQQRSDPWHIITWLTELRVKRMIIENVWEFIGWGPVDPRTGKPIKSRKGEYFQTWIKTIRGLGYDPEWKNRNAADFGEATTRRRFILKARYDRIAVGWAPLTHAKREANILPFADMKPWRPAREIIDWSIKGKSIFNRKKPLAPKTLARIYAGAVKFGWPEPFLVILRNHMAGQSVDSPLPTIAANGTHIGLAQPVMLANRTNNAPKSFDEPAPAFTTAHGGGIAVAEPIILSNHNSGAPRGATEPLPTITTGGAGAPKREGCARPMLAEPVIIATAHGNDANEADPNNRRARDIDQPLGTIHAGGGNFAVAEPVIMNGRKGNQAKGVSSDPIPTLDTKSGVWLAEPFILGRNGTEGGEAARRARSVDEPAPTSTNRGAGYVVQPFILSRHAEGAPRSLDEPTPTQVAKQSHVLISPYYGSGSGETCQSADEPLPTVTSKGRFGMVVPITHADGSDRARDVDTDPIPTITTANRGELAFITAQHGERPGQAPRVHGVDQPTPTIAASGHVDLIEATAEYDILFRMLEPHELAAAMGFTTEEATYEFAGTKTQQIKQIGNAVSVALMKAEVKAIMADAVPKRHLRSDQDVPAEVKAIRA
jgi:DNA (cytosine-5)-methyltransferase 1